MVIKNEEIREKKPANYQSHCLLNVPSLSTMFRVSVQFIIPEGI